MKRTKADRERAAWETAMRKRTRGDWLEARSALKVIRRGYAASVKAARTKAREQAAAVRGATRKAREVLRERAKQRRAFYLDQLKTKLATERAALHLRHAEQLKQIRALGLERVATLRAEKAAAAELVARLRASMASHRTAKQAKAWDKVRSDRERQVDEARRAMEEAHPDLAAYFEHWVTQQKGKSTKHGQRRTLAEAFLEAVQADRGNIQAWSDSQHEDRTERMLRAISQIEATDEEEWERERDRITREHME